MVKYIAHRLLLMVPVILGISLIIFTIMNLTPGDPATMILGENATPEDVHALREEMGLNRPFLVRYADYIVNAVRGDFGRSYRTNLPVFDEIAFRIPTTLTLSFWSILLAVCIGIPIGIVSAVKQYSVIDIASLTVTLLLAAVPAFWLGLMLMLIFSLRINLLPASGVDTWHSFIMPSITLGAGAMTTLIRMTRSSLLEVIRQDYIRTARAKGAQEKSVIFKHALKNALLPIITSIGLAFGNMLGGSLVVETVFAMPGVGTLMITAIRMKDTPQVMASVMFVALMVGIVNLLVDILYAYVDPRIKSQYVKKA